MILQSRNMGMNKLFTKNKIVTLVYSFVVLFIPCVIYGQKNNMINWEELSAFRVVNSKYDISSPLPVNLDSISVLIDLTDALKIFKKMVSDGRNCEFPGHRYGLLVFKNGAIKYIRIHGNGFNEVSDKSKYYFLRGVKRELREEWLTYVMRVSGKIKDSIISEFNKTTNNSTYNVLIDDKIIAGYNFYEGYKPTCEFLFYNFTNHDIEKFTECDNVIFNGIAFLASIYRHYNANFTYRELIKLARRTEKQLIFNKYNNESITLAAFCFNFLVEEQNSPIHNLSTNKIERIKSKINKHFPDGADMLSVPLSIKHKGKKG